MHSMSTHHQSGHQPLTQALVEVNSHITLMPKYNIFNGRRNTTFWCEVGKMGVGETGVGKQVPTALVPPIGGGGDWND